MTTTDWHRAFLASDDLDTDFLVYLDWLAEEADPEDVEAARGLPGMVEELQGLIKGVTWGEKGSKYVKIISRNGEGYYRLLAGSGDAPGLETAQSNSGCEVLARAAFYARQSGCLEPLWQWFEAKTGCRRCAVNRNSDVGELWVSFRLPTEWVRMEGT